MTAHRQFSVPASARSGASRGALGAAAAVVALLLSGSSTPARASLVLQVENSTAPVGGTGSFDVVLLDTGGTFAVTGFQVQLAVPGGSGVQFTGVDTSTTTAPYIFGTLQTPPLSFDTFPNTTFTASDSDATPPFFVTLNTGDEVGLLHASYSVAAGTPNTPVPVSIVTAGTLLFDNTTPIPNTIPYTPVDGTITPTAAVPEPSILAMAAVGGAVLLACQRRRQRLRAPSHGA